MDLVELAEHLIEQADALAVDVLGCRGLTMWWLTQRLIAVMKPYFIGRSTSQNRIVRLTSVAFSALFMKVSSKMKASPSRQTHSTPSTRMRHLFEFGVTRPR